MLRGFDVLPGGYGGTRAPPTWTPKAWQAGEVVKAAAAIDDIPELHDRLIAGTAAWLGIPILTSDPVMMASQYVQTVWR